MMAHDLKPEQFSSYPAESRKLAIRYLGTLQSLPLSFLPSLLRELSDYDFKFPAERRTVENELATLASLSVPQREEWFTAFALNWSAPTGQGLPRSS